MSCQLSGQSCKSGGLGSNLVGKKYKCTFFSFLLENQFFNHLFLLFYRLLASAGNFVRPVLFRPVYEQTDHASNEVIILGLGKHFLPALVPPAKVLCQRWSVCFFLSGESKNSTQHSTTVIRPIIYVLLIHILCSYFKKI